MPTLKIKSTTAQPPERVTFRGATYRLALQVVPRVPEPTWERHQRPHTFSPTRDPSRVQARQALKQEIINDLEALVRHLAEAPVGPSELREKFDQFSSGIATMTDTAKLPLEDGLKNLASSFRKLLKAREAIERMRF
jgi:hypothetical protein